MLRTALDHPLLARLGIINLAPGSTQAVRSCLDWTERKPHLAGRLGTHLLTAMINQAWIRRSPNDRSVSITAAGRAALSSLDALPEFHPQAS